jgi:hypothetical protein
MPGVDKECGRDWDGRGMDPNKLVIYVLYTDGAFAFFFYS